MAKYELILIKKGLRTRQVEKIAKAVRELGISVSIRKVEEPKTRSERLAKAEELAEEAKSIVEELFDEMENWRDGMEGTGLENTAKYNVVSEACDNLEEIKSQLEDIDWYVEFPTMYG